jgi:Ca2+-binding EF-hand superfamily protein
LARIAVSAADPPSAADAALFDRLDADHNGQVTAGEVSAEHQRLLRLLRQGDSDGDKALSRDEFIAGLVPSRPEKPIEAKQPASFPQADAVRWLLLTMDTNGNSSIDEEEVPEKLLRVFDAMAKRIDGNKDGVLDRRELSQGGPPLAQIAGRYVQNEGIDAAANWSRKEISAAARRFAPPAAGQPGRSEAGC